MLMPSSLRTTPIAGDGSPGPRYVILSAAKDLCTEHDILGGLVSPPVLRCAQDDRVVDGVAVGSAPGELKTGSMSRLLITDDRE